MLGGVRREGREMKDERREADGAAGLDACGFVCAGLSLGVFWLAQMAAIWAGGWRKGFAMDLDDDTVELLDLV